MATSENKWRGLIQGVLGLSLTFLFFYMMAPFLVSILLGGIFALLCFPAQRALRKHVPTALSAAIVTLLIALGIFMPAVLTLYAAAYRVVQMIGSIKLPQNGPLLESLVHHPLIARLSSSLGRLFPVDSDWLRNQAVETAQVVLDTLGKLAGALITGMPGLLLAFFVVLISLFFFLRDGERFLLFLEELSPINKKRSELLFQTFALSCRGVVLGVFLSALAQAVIAVILFLITGLPTPFLFGALTLVMGMVPVVGSGPVWIGATIYLVAEGTFGLAVVMALGGILIGISDNIVRAWVLSGPGEIHPMLALVSVFGAVNLFGATGIFLGPVVAAIFVSFLRIVSLEMGGGKSSSVGSN